jgi:hypothetical protein
VAQNTIPTITTIPGLSQWQAGLRQTLFSPTSPPIPANFAVASKQGGNYLTWATVKGADGYRVQVSTDGNFATILTAFLLPGNTATAYFDTVPTATGTAPAVRYYRVAATAGTVKNPQSTVGKPTSVLSSTAIAPNDTATASVAASDLSNRDALNAKSGNGNYIDLE